MRENIVLLVSDKAQGIGESLIEGDSFTREFRPVAEAMMAACRNSWLAPTEDEAFVAWVAALAGVFVDKKDTIIAEAKWLGDQARVLAALESGIALDMSSIGSSQPPDGAVGLVDIWRGEEE